MANKNPVLNYKNRKALDMPTRERLLCLMKILQSYDKSNPLLQVELPEIMDIFYYDYVFKEFLNMFPNTISDDTEESFCALHVLIDINNNRINEFIIYDRTDEEMSDNNWHLPNEYDYLDEYSESELIDILLDYFDEEKKRDEYYNNKLRSALCLIQDRLSAEDDEPLDISHIIGQSTLIKDLKILERYDYLKRTNKRNLYGLSARKSLELWQLKIIYELINNVRFLKDEERRDILETIMFVTSKTNHDLALELCHSLEEDLYSTSSTFRYNLDELLKIQLKVNAAEKKNPERNASATVRFHYRHSRLDRSDRTPDDENPITCFPIDIVAKDGYFYLLGASEHGVRAYRVDRIVNPEYIEMDFGYTLKYPEYAHEKTEFYKNNTNNFPGGDHVDVVIKWNFDTTEHYTALFDVFGYENISQGNNEDQFIIKTRDNYGMYLNLLRLGPVIEVMEPLNVRDAYGLMLKAMYEKYQN